MSTECTLNVPNGDQLIYIYIYNQLSDILVIGFKMYHIEEQQGRTLQRNPRADLRGSSFNWYWLGGLIWRCHSFCWTENDIVPHVLTCAAAPSAQNFV